MATNPQFPNEKRPESQRRPELVERGLPILKKSRFPWPLLAIIVAAAILVALIAWLPRTPHVRPAPSAAQVPQQPTGSQIQLSNVKMVPSPTGGAFYLTALLHNQGTSQINGIQVQVVLQDTHGKVLAAQLHPVEQLTDTAGGREEGLTNAPIKPNESRPVRVYFDHPPAGWDKQVPQLKVTTVTGTPA